MTLILTWLILIVLLDFSFAHVNEQSEPDYSSKTMYFVFKLGDAREGQVCYENPEARTEYEINIHTSFRPEFAVEILTVNAPLTVICQTEPGPG